MKIISVKGNNMEKYKEIKFKGYDWYYLGQNEEGKEIILMKDVLDEEHIKKYVDDDFMRCGNEVRYNDNIRINDFEKSYIKNVVLENFKKDLDVNCEVTLISKEEVEELPNEIRSCEYWYWTRSPYNEFISSYYRAWYVDSVGYVHGPGVDSTFSVRPVLYLEFNLLFGENAKPMICSQKVNKIEIIEDKPKKIKKLGFNSDYSANTIKILKKINEIIDKIEELENNERIR